MNSELPFSIEEVIKALRPEDDGSGPQGVTSGDVARHLGIAQSTAQRWIKLAVDGGRVRFVGTRKVARSDGKPALLPVYAPVKRDEAAA